MLHSRSLTTKAGRQVRTRPAAHTVAAAAAATACVGFYAKQRHRTPAQCNAIGSSSYYGSYLADRFGGGVGRRVGIDESRKVPLIGTGVVRVTHFAETHESLSTWATSENWREATRIHKAAFFTNAKRFNLAQELIIEKIRDHYVASSKNGYVAEKPIQAALYRCEDTTEMLDRAQKLQLTSIPSIVRGTFNESEEPWIVDFANKRLGGAWLGYGMAQEEKFFIERPDYGALCAKSLLEMPDPLAEPIASPFSMHPNEAWILRGAPRFAEVRWYGYTPKDALSKMDLLDPAHDRGTMPSVVCIDAIKASFTHYNREHLQMMLAKAYTGFAAARHDPQFGGARTIATGSWGCGAFMNGEPVMFVVQTLAANLAGLRLHYHTLCDGRDLTPAFEFLESAMKRGLTVASAFDELVDLCAKDPNWTSKFKPRQG